MTCIQIKGKVKSREEWDGKWQWKSGNKQKQGKGDKDEAGLRKKRRITTDKSKVER